MKIWVDADACPVAIKEILYRAADRTKTYVTLIANQYLRTPRSKFIDHIQVPKGFDVADNEIVKRSEPGDLVITSDIPLADEVVSKGCLALSPRGELFTKENIKPRLNIGILWKHYAIAAFKQAVLLFYPLARSKHLEIALINRF